MISNKTLLELVEYGAKGESASFQMLVRRLASKIRNSDPELASCLMERMPTSQSLRGGPPDMPAPVDADSRQKLLIEYYPVQFEREPVWSEVLKGQLQRVIFERENANKLLDSGLVPIRSMIFEGPPGLGKTLAAKWLARELDLPLLVLDLATVMSSFLGKTGSNIRSVLNYASTFPCVLLLDEFDAIAKRRDDDHDVGELKRLVTVLLQAIDDWPTASVLIAATNHGELLDPAVWRRFDLNIHFEYPNQPSIERVLRSRGIDDSLVALISENFTGKSFSDIDRMVNLLCKSSLLEERPLLDVFIEHCTRDPSSSGIKTQRDLNVLKLHAEGKSQREINRITGVSRQTIKKVIERVAES